MKKRSIALTAIILLAALTAFAAVWHLTTRTAVDEGDLLVTYGSHSTALKLDGLSFTHVEGEVVNGKGEVKEIDAQGISLADALSGAGVSPDPVSKVTVIAADEYRAELSGDEVRESDVAWLIQQSDGVQMIVFGDPNSKRNVTHVVRLEVE